MEHDEEGAAQITEAAMSVVLVSLDHYRRIRLTTAALSAQTARHRLEIIVVAPTREGLGIVEADFDPFHSYRVVEVGSIRSTGEAVAAGFEDARAPVVAYAEEHSYPFPTWAEALLRAHEKPWAGVGVAIANANPATTISWANLFVDFGAAVDPAVGGVTTHLAWHHGSYKRDLLAIYKTDQLQTFLETEGLLHQALLDRGYELYLEPTARSNHVNVSSVRALLRCEFVGGRLFGAARARQQNWTWARRLLYILGSPLIPVLRLRRTLKDIKASGRFDELFPAILPGMVTALIAHCIGEITGYAFGAGDAAWQRVPCELNRCEFLRDSEKAQRTGEA